MLLFSSRLVTVLFLLYLIQNLTTFTIKKKSRQGTSPQYQYLIFGSCHLILFVSSGNYFQIVRRQCCLKEGGEIFTWICHITQWALTRVLPCWLWRCHVWIAVTDGSQLKISDQISGLFVQLGLHPVLLLLADHPHHDRWISCQSKIQCNNKQVEQSNHKKAMQ